jgi:uncharacterized membrane protein YidH (DUF202 family)
MLERVHQHIERELRQSARTDTLFVLAAVAFNLIVLAVNWNLAGDSVDDSFDLTTDLVIWTLGLVSLAVNGIAVSALLHGWKTRSKLLDGALAMYRDNDLERYYDPSLPAHYRRRYWLFAGVILCLGVIAIVVPLVVRYCSGV